jgi:hypothetical protein
MRRRALLAFGDLIYSLPARTDEDLHLDYERLAAAAVGK